GAHPFPTRRSSDLHIFIFEYGENELSQVLIILNHQYRWVVIYLLFFINMRQLSQRHFLLQFVYSQRTEGVINGDIISKMSGAFPKIDCKFTTYLLFAIHFYPGVMLIGHLFHNRQSYTCAGFTRIFVKRLESTKQAVHSIFTNSNPGIFHL